MTSPVTASIQQQQQQFKSSNTPPVPFSSYNTPSSNNKTNTTTSIRSPSAAMATTSSSSLTPSLRVKTNELFYKWLSSRERADQLREAINIIKNTSRVPRITDLETFKIDEKTFSGGHYGHHQPLTSSSSSSSNHQQYYYANSDNMSSSSLVGNNKQQSSGRPSSPPMSPIPAHLRMPMSPKSPRNRPNSSSSSKTYADLLLQQQQQQQQQQKQPSNSILVQLTDQTRQQSPRDFDNKSGMKITASSSINNSTGANNKQSKPSNEKEIQIQRISSSSSSQQPGSPSAISDNKKNDLSGSPKVNYVDVQVVKSDLAKTAANGVPSTATNNKTFTPVITVQQQVQHLQPVTVTKQVLKQQQQPKVSIPSFHFPHGRAEARQFKSAEDVECMRAISAKFKSLGKGEGKLNKDEFGEVVKLLDLPFYWKILIFRACTQNAKLNYITYAAFEQGWPRITSSCFDKVSLFVKLISSSSNNNAAISPSSAYIVYEDWEPLLQDIVDTHPGLKFLHDHKEFHSRYIKTVIARIYYTVNRSWSGRITLAELKRSNFLQVLESIEHEDDINSIKDFFSYEHFYVIYCKFWELDKDHDLLINREDLYRHNNYSISVKVIDRIFSGTVFKSKDPSTSNNRDSTGSGNNTTSNINKDGLMSYYDFVWFLISEEDKRNPTSIEYWFRVLDLDGDGVLSMYELEYFYNEQIDQMRERQIEFMPFNDLLCQILDLVKPQEPGKIRLKDLKNCKMTNVFFDTFINLEKYLEYEQRDPFSNIRDLDSPEQSDWDKYAAEEYENLVSEDYNADNQDPYNNYDDDFEDDPLLFNSPTSTSATPTTTTLGGGATTSNNGIS